MNMRKVKAGVKEAKTVRLCCSRLVIEHFKEALVTEQITEILTIL